MRSRPDDTGALWGVAAGLAITALLAAAMVYDSYTAQRDMRTECAARGGDVVQMSARSGWYCQERRR